MTDHHQADGWDAVPHVAAISGTRDAAPGPVTDDLRRPRRPRSRPVRRRTLVALIAGAAALLLVVVGGIVGFSVGAGSHTADRPVRAFLDDLTAGRVAAALTDAGIDHDSSDVLLTESAYRAAEDTVTGYRVARVRQGDGTATVDVYLRQGGRDVGATFTLTQTGTDWGVFPVWHLDAPRLGTVDVAVRGPSGTRFDVAGRSLRTPQDGTVTLSALPGTYPVTLDGGKWVASTRSSATVSGFGGTASSPVSIATTLTAAGRQAATKAVDGWVDACIASADPAPSGCSFYAYGEDPAYTYTNEHWTLDTRPVVSVGDWTSAGWIVTTTTYGRATFTADISGPGGVGTASAGPMNVNASGWITGFTADGASFRSAVAGSSAESGS